MKIATMLRDVFPSLFEAPVTERYPLERKEPPARLRSHLRWDREKCTGCGLCALDCPAQAIEMIVIDKKGKRFVLGLQADRCTFCAQCTFSCRQGCLEMTGEIWELAALSRQPLAVYYGDDDDIRQIRSGAARPEPMAPAIR